MYLRETEIKLLLQNLKKRCGGFTLIFDAFSVFTAKKIKNHPSIKKTGAEIHWGLDNPQELEKWDAAIYFIEEIYFTSNEEIEKLVLPMKIMFKLAGLFPMAKKAQRILVYRADR